MRTIRKAAWLLLLALLACAPPTFPEQPLSGKNFPGGYIDSPYVLRSGKAIYFLHSPAPVKGFGFPWADPATQPLPGHHAKDDPLFWFNSDLYVSRRNPDGSFGPPRNLGNQINTKHLECCVWVNEAETALLFTRESLDNEDTSPTGNYIVRRNSPDQPWGQPHRLSGELGRYLEGGRGIHDLHPGKSGNVYGWSEKAGGHIFAASGGLSHHPAPARMLKTFTPDGWHDSQPWVNSGETEMIFNRWQDMDRELWFAKRPSRAVPWKRPQRIRLRGFADPNGHLVWGEPSFTKEGTMYFVRFNTAREGWAAELMSARKNPDGSYGPPERLRFRF